MNDTTNAIQSFLGIDDSLLFYAVGGCLLVIVVAVLLLINKYREDSKWFASLAKSEKDLDATKENIFTLKARETQLNKTIAELEHKIDDVRVRYQEAVKSNEGLEELARHLQQMQGEFDSYQRQLAVIQKKISDAQIDLLTKQGLIEQAEKQQKLYEKNQADFDAVKAKLEAIRRELEDKKQELQKTDIALSVQEQLKQLLKNLAGSQSSAISDYINETFDIKELQAQKASLEADNKVLKNQHTEAQQQLTTARQDLDKAKEDLQVQKSAAAVSSYINEALQTDKLRQEQSELRATSDVLQKANTDAQNQLTAVRKDLVKAKEDLQVQKSAAVVSSYINEALQTDKLRQEQSELRATSDVLQKANTDAQNQLTVVRKDLVKAKEDLQVQKSAAVVSSYINEALQTDKLKQEQKELRATSDVLQKANTDAQNQLTAVRKDLVKAKEDLQVQKSAAVVSSYINEALQTDKLRQEQSELRATSDVLQKANTDAQNQLTVVRKDLVKAKEDLQVQKSAAVVSSYIKEALQTEALKKEKDSLIKERDTLIQDVESKKADRKQQFSDLYQLPDFLKGGRSDNRANILGSSSSDEIKVLQDFQKHLRSKDYIFSMRMIKAFHTSLKIQEDNPLTVLAGYSGTGKTLLPTEYAEFMGFKPLVISVQPRWDSPQDLLGFFNYLNNRYQPTDLVRALCAMDFIFRDNKGLDNKHLVDHDDYANALKKEGIYQSQPMVLVLLDEMNLARTEYYFSEFLSKLELRRAVLNKDHLINGEHDLHSAEIVVGDALRLIAPPNMLFTGTMNEDESTQTLSDKVLDRANVLRFGSPDYTSHINRLLHHEQNTTVSGKAVKGYRITYPVWSAWLNRDIQTDLDKDIKNALNGWLTELNKIMSKVGRPFGVRVLNSIFSYIRHYPHEYKTDIHTYQMAMADQIEQKALPKLRGLDMNDHIKTQLKSLSEFVENKLDDKALSSALSDAIDNSDNTGIFNWTGLTRSDEEK